MSRTDSAATGLGPASRGTARAYALLLVPAIGLFACLPSVRGKPQLIVFSLMAALLATAHILPRVRRGSMRGAALLFAVGFAGSVAALNLAFDRIGLVRDIQPNQQLAFLAGQAGDKPVLLLVGSSFTQYGIDEAALEARLDAAGRPMHVLRLGFGGMSSIERYYYLRRLLRNTALRPAAVLFEVSRYYEMAPLLQLEQNLYSDRMIEMMDFTSARLALDWILTAGPRPFEPPLGLRERLRLAGHVLAHAALHYSRSGFLPVMGSVRRLAPHSFSEPPRKTAAMSDAEVASLLDEAFAGMKRTREPAAVGLPNAWSDALSAEMMALLGKAGTVRFGFYNLPTTTPAELIYANLFCRGRTELPCISPTDEALYDELRHEAYWLDRYHLHGPGRDRVTRWLAEQILRRMAAPQDPGRP